MKKPTGRPSKRTDEVIARIIDGLRKGTPLTIICGAEDMPATSTVYDWAGSDQELSGAIARAREEGFDQIAIDALSIADEVTEQDTIETQHGPIPNKEWLMRSKLRVETRLKLLAKWDPKRYGEMIKHAGADGGPMAIVVSSEDASA
ncbi:MAG: hypothetical protein PGN16_04275 [Sphingomonas phyllosphaerae]|uniref:terminase small subunit-like protein n=1 Tax=Sphingomonas phyllosphaerae TaxID=257003 RepID=UPI002FF58CBF